VKISWSNTTRWIAGKLAELLGIEDDVVIELCFNLLEGTRFVCILSSRRWAHNLIMKIAKHQESPNSAYGLP